MRSPDLKSLGKTGVNRILLQASVSISLYLYLYLNVVIILIKNASHVIGLNCHCIEFLHVDVFSDITSRSESVLRCLVISRQNKIFSLQQIPPLPLRPQKIYG